MERVIIDIELSKLQKLHDKGHIHNGDYTAVQTYTEGFKEDPEYVKIATQLKVKGKEMQELYKQLADFKDNYDAIPREGNN